MSNNLTDSDGEDGEQGEEGEQREQREQGEEGEGELETTHDVLRSSSESNTSDDTFPIRSSNDFKEAGASRVVDDFNNLITVRANARRKKEIPKTRKIPKHFKNKSAEKFWSSIRQPPHYHRKRRYNLFPEHFYTPIEPTSLEGLLSNSGQVEYLRRLKKGLVYHYSSVKAKTVAGKRIMELRKYAKYHRKIMYSLDSLDERAKYIVGLLDQKSYADEWVTVGKHSTAPPFKVSARKLVKAILSHFTYEELQKHLPYLDKYVAINSLITEEIAASTMLRTINVAKRRLLGIDVNKDKRGTPASIVVRPFNLSGYAEPFLRVQRFDKTEQRHPFQAFVVSDFTKSLQYGMRSIVPSFELFKHAFNAFTSNFFHGVDISGGIFTGGSVCACLQPLSKDLLEQHKKYRELRRAIRGIPLPSYVLQRVEFFAGIDSCLQEFKDQLAKRYFKSEYISSDIDIFIIAKSLEEAEKTLHRLYNNIEKRFQQLGVHFIVARTANAITFCADYPYRPIQLIVSTLRSIEDFLLFCDMDCTSCIYNGREVLMSNRSVRAFNKRCNLVPPAIFVSNSKTRPRLLKYAARGFSSMVFELCNHLPRCDVVLAQDLYLRKMQPNWDEYNELRIPFFKGVGLHNIVRHCLENDILWGLKLHHVWEEGGGTAKGWQGEESEEDWEDSEEEKKWKNGLRKEFDFTNPSQYFGWRRAGGHVPKAVITGMRWKWEDSLKSMDNEHALPRCYMCKKRVVPNVELARAGLTLCDSCVTLNEKMMSQWDSVTRLGESVALVTGARIKIGYYIALRLLRSGCTVIGVTRFPHDAAARYAEEPDYENWKNKLHIYGVDLRHLPSVNEFIAHVMKHYTRIDMLINNAAQTKRRPRAYYYSVFERERKLMGGEASCDKYLIKNYADDPYLIEQNPENQDLARAVLKVPVMALGEVAIDPTLPKSAALAQVPLHPMDLAQRDDALFPPGKVDEHNEPLDLRTSTSWDQSIDQISTVELLEVQIVNSTVPFMLISTLNPLLKKAAKASYYKRAFVVNVTAVEGNFNLFKNSGGHPHTNMAKASLNMMTKSIADNFAKDNIYTTAVDTGWCTEMRYVPMEMRDDRGAPLKPVPLTDRDGAARVLYPIYFGLTSEDKPPHGVLYHDFKVVPWN